jgi:type I restriction enzyme, S subunit
VKRGWEPSRIGELLTIQNGFAFDSKSFSESKGVPLIRIRDLRGGQKTETKYDGPFDKRYEVKSGDLLIGMDGEFGCYEWRGGRALLNQRVCRLQGFSGKLEPKFLFYGINKHLKEIEDATTYTTVKHLSSKQIANIEIPLPPVQEQKRIVAILDETFAGLATATANTEKNLKNARELFDSYLNSIFGHPDEDWTVCPLADCLEFITYGFTNPMPTTDSGPWMVTAKNIVGGKIDYNSARHTSRYAFETLLTDKSRPNVGDVLLTKDGTLGRLAVVDRSEICINQSVALLRPNGRMIPHFMKFLLSNRNYQNRMIGDADGATIKHIYITRVDKMDVAFPSSVDKQKNIVSSLDAASATSWQLESAYKRKLDALKELKRSILHKAFSGELTSPPSQAIKEAAE